MWFLKFSLWTKLTLNPESVWFYVIQWNHNAWTHWLHLGSLQVIYDRLNEICDLEDFQQKPSSSRFSRKAMLITIPFPISKSNFWHDFKKIKRFFLILDKIIDSEWRPELMEVRSWFMQPVRQKTYHMSHMKSMICPMHFGGIRLTPKHSEKRLFCGNYEKLTGYLLSYIHIIRVFELRKADLCWS